MSKEEFEELKRSRAYSNRDVAIAIENNLGVQYSGDDLIKDFEHSSFMSKAKTGVVRGCFLVLQHKDKLKSIERALLGFLLLF